MTSEPIGTDQAWFAINGDQASAHAFADALERLAALVRERPPVAAEYSRERVADVSTPEGAALNARHSKVAVEVQW